jgi:hypothetical protein
VANSKVIQEFSRILFKEDFMEIIACWHHADRNRLFEHLAQERIDLYGRNERTQKGTLRLNHWWARMRLKVGDRVRIVVAREIIACAMINSGPKDLPANQVKGVWGTYVELNHIKILPKPYLASCEHLRMSHRFDGPKTSKLAH